MGRGFEHRKESQLEEKQRYWKKLGDKYIGHKDNDKDDA